MQDATEPNEDAQAGAEDEQWLTVLRLNCDFSAGIFLDVMDSLIKAPNLTSTFLIRADILVDQPEVKYPSQLREEFRPRSFTLPGWTQDRVIVRKLVPRNAQVDDPLIQTCLIFSRPGEQKVIYVPHAEVVPYYHPKVRAIDFSFREGSIELSFQVDELTERLKRTGLKLLQTVHKHGHGLMNGYEKRVHHDQLVPQRQYQETYARMKAKYAKKLVEEWVEPTDPGKHVFEELGIAAFLIELWRGQDVFFIDIGCGNGLLTYLLLSEGCSGYGFDARRRKTWSIFPPEVQEKLVEKVFVPSVLGGEELPSAFLVSNHADELTAWTPLLAALHGCQFLALPCCSHDFGGRRFRAPANGVRLPQQESSSLKRTLVQKKMASAYSTLCSYVESLTVAMGFELETEVLRIPSTRNHAIIGRKQQGVVGAREVVELVEREMQMGIDDVARQWEENGRLIARKPGSGH